LWFGHSSNHPWKNTSKSRIKGKWKGILGVPRNRLPSREGGPGNAGEQPPLR